MRRGLGMIKHGTQVRQRFSDKSSPVFTHNPCTFTQSVSIKSFPAWHTSLLVKLRDTSVCEQDTWSANKRRRHNDVDAISKIDTQLSFRDNFSLPLITRASLQQVYMFCWIKEEVKRRQRPQVRLVQCSGVSFRENVCARTDDRHLHKDNTHTRLSHTQSLTGFTLIQQVLFLAIITNYCHNSTGSMHGKIYEQQ